MGLASLQLDPDRANHVFICGRKGSGKSELAAMFWRAYPYDRLVVDPTHDVDAGDDAIDLEDPLPTRWPAKLGAGKRMTLRYPADPGSDTYVLDMDQAVSLAFLHGRGLLWVDEVGDLTSANSTPPAMRRVLHQARHRRLSTLFCGPRPMDVNPLVYSQADYIAAFEMRNRADRKRLAEVCGFGLDEFEDALAEAVSVKRPGDKQPHGFVWWDAIESEMLIMPPLPVARSRRRQHGDRFRDQPEPDELVG